MVAVRPSLNPFLVLPTLAVLVHGLLQCPENPGWTVIDQNGGTGGRWKIPGDFIMHKTPLNGATGLRQGTPTYIAVNFTLTSAFDNVDLPCFGETTTDKPGNFTLDNTGEGFVNGTCRYTGNLMGAVETAFQYNLDYTQADLYVYQDFECNRTITGRPWRVHADSIHQTIDLSCDDTGLICESLYPYDFGVYYVPLFPPAPLTNCSAGVMDRSVPFVIRNISYNSVQSSKDAPVLGAAYVEMSMPLIDFTMRCLPSGDEMAWTWKGSSETWYDCKADFTNPVDTPATWIKFNHTTFEVTVKQEFTCDDVDKTHPEYVTAQGSTLVPWECADTYNGKECWSTKITTITATNVTELSKPPGARVLKVIKGGARHEPTRQTIELLVKAGVLDKDRLNPDVLHVLSNGT